MSARAPLDVDLEDKLIYGLTPIRLTYFVAGLLAAYALWSSHWAPGVVRGLIAVLTVCIAAAAAWGKWRNRPFDAWAVDAMRFVVANHEVVWSARLRIAPAFRRVEVVAVARRVKNSVTAYI